MDSLCSTAGPRVMIAVLALLMGTVLVGCASQVAANPVDRGKQVFQTCQPCHGSAGEGHHELGAPALAGRSAAVLEQQLQEFRTGLRGTQFDDLEGMRMRPMALSLASDDDVRAVAAYVSTLPPVEHPPLIEANIQAGQALFTACKGCHGPDGAGNRTLKIPRIAGVEDWYLAAQLKKFRKGVRGSRPGDKLGPLMRPIASSLPDEEAIRNVAAYVSTLKPAREDSPNGL